MHILHLFDSFSTLALYKFIYLFTYLLNPLLHVAYSSIEFLQKFFTEHGFVESLNTSKCLSVAEDSIEK